MFFTLRQRSAAGCAALAICGFAVPWAAAPLAAQPIPAADEMRRVVGLRPYLVAFQSGTERQATPARRRAEIALGEKIGWRLRWADGPYRVWDQVRPGEQLEHVNRFRVQRGYRTHTGAPYGGDVIEILNLTTNDIDAVKRVLMGYLTTSFEYHPDRAAGLADLILRYNQRIRGDMDYARRHYTPEVVALLEEHKLGIAEHYYYWSGRTQLLVPLKEYGSPELTPATPATPEPQRPAPPTVTAEKPEAKPEAEPPKKKDPPWARKEQDDEPWDGPRWKSRRVHSHIRR